MFFPILIASCSQRRQLGDRLNCRAGWPSTKLPCLQVRSLAPILQQVEGTDRSNADSSAIEMAEQGLKAIATLAKFMLQMHADAVPTKLGELTITMHNEALLEIQDSPSVVDAVVKLCIDYWTSGAPDAGALSIQMVRLHALSFHKTEPRRFQH